MRKITQKHILAFRREVWRFYRRHRRDLPFRDTTDPYAITVAEVMLQQTQVERVVPYYAEWITRWPDWASLARAENRQILEIWSGLGYNRRALYLGQLANRVMTDFGGKLPSDPQVLQTLPGIGPYTAHAILIFAFNRSLITIDTNIRKVLLFEFALPTTTSKQELETLAKRILPRGRARDWHNALMDYGNLALPRRMEHIPPATRQSRFDGSRRQIRGAIVKALVKRRQLSIAQLPGMLPFPKGRIREALDSLRKDGLIVKKNSIIRLA